MCVGVSVSPKRQLHNSIKAPAHLSSSSSPTLHPSNYGGPSTSSPVSPGALEFNNVAPLLGGITSRRRHNPPPTSNPSSSSSSGASSSSTLLPSHGKRKPAQIKVAVDVDEVLGRFVHTLNRFCKDHYEMEYHEKDYFIYEFAKIWNCSQEHSNHIVHEFFKSQHFNDGIPVIPGALEALTRMQASHELVVVTSRQHVIQEATLEWIDRHYEGVFQEVYFGNHFALEGVSRRKSEICKAIGASVLIDDNPGYAMECAEAGINVLLYDWNLDYPWSKLAPGKMHPLITIVRDWEEVEAAVTALRLIPLDESPS